MKKENKLKNQLEEARAAFNAWEAIIISVRKSWNSYNDIGKQDLSKFVESAFKQVKEAMQECELYEGQNTLKAKIL